MQALDVTGLTIARAAELIRARELSPLAQLPRSRERGADISRGYAGVE
jgi:hypothetical protein